MKTETLIARLLRNGALPGRLLLRPAGPFRRRYAGEIEKTEETEIGYFKGQVVTLNRSGIYDHLPEQLFHLRLEPAYTLEAKTSDIRRQRRKEQESRLFFAPIDHEFGMQRVAIEETELRCLTLVPGSAFVAKLRDFWEIPPEIDDTEFLRLLPWLPRLSGGCFSARESEKVLTALLEEKVSVREIPEPARILPESPRLGSPARLGMETVLGGKVSSCLHAYVVTIYPGSPGKWIRYITGKTGETLVSWLFRRIFPAGMEVSTRIHFPPESCGFELAPDNPTAGRLSYSTVLSRDAGHCAFN